MATKSVRAYGLFLVKLCENPISQKQSTITQQLKQEITQIIHDIGVFRGNGKCIDLTTFNSQVARKSPISSPLVEKLLLIPIYQ